MVKPQEENRWSAQLDRHSGLGSSGEIRAASGVPTFPGPACQICCVLFGHMVQCESPSPDFLPATIPLRP